MLSFIVAIVLFVAARAYDDELSCGPTAPQCPANHRCVVGAGCVALNMTCRCPAKPCEWPLRCDCKVGCAVRACHATTSCGRQLVNPKNACERLECRRGRCQAMRLACDNCDPAKGCPVAARVARGDASTAAQGDQKRGDWVDNRYESDAARADAVGARDGGDWDGGSGWHRPNNADTAVVIFYGVFLGVVGLILLALFGYWWYSSSNKKKSEKTEA
jgi:hypothetical protein